MVTISAGPEVVAKYKDLLVSEWDKNLPEHVSGLLWTAVGGSESGSENTPLSRMLEPTDAVDFPLDFFRSIFARIADGTRFVRIAGLPDLPAVYSPRKAPSGPARRAIALATYLTLPAHTTITGETGFFTDLLALAFQAAIHELLPAIKKRHPAEHSILLHSAVLFCAGFSANDAAHASYMMSMIHGYLGDDQQRLQSLFASFRLTSPSDHSYLTKAQEVWTELLEQERFDETEQFLLSLPRWSLPAQQEEIRDMVVEAFKHIVKHEPGRSKPVHQEAPSLTPFFV